MNLTTYAVHRKLTADDPLLAYVAKGVPVPTDVLAASFAEYLEPLTDEVSEGLVDDYAATLSSQVPIVVQPGADGGYEVSGDIPDTMVEAIELIHGAGEEDIVRALVDHNLGTVHGKSCDLIDIDITRAAERTKIALSSLPAVEPVMDASALAADVLADVNLPEPVQDEILEDAADIEADYEAAPEADGTADTEMENRQNQFQAAMRMVYDKFLADLRAYGLDSRLHLNIA